MLLIGVLVGSALTFLTGYVVFRFSLRHLAKSDKPVLVDSGDFGEIADTAGEYEGDAE